MDKTALTATHWLVSRAVATALVCLGGFALVSAISGRQPFGVDPADTWRVLAAGLGLMLLLAARTYWHVSQMRVQTAETSEALHQLLYGKDFRRDREAIEILLVALEKQTGENAKTAHAHLVRLTGQNFAMDPKVWRSWWEANKAQFERKR